MKTGRLILVFLTALGCGSAALGEASSQPASAPAPEIMGCWKNSDDYLVRFEPGRMVSVFRGEMLINRVLAYEAGKVVFSRSGPYSEMRYSIASIAGKKILTLPDQQPSILTQLSEVPDVLVLKPTPLGKADKLPADRTKQIQTDLAAHKKQHDAIVRQGNWDNTKKVLAENTAWMKALVGEVGWIDADRFGPEAAKAAFGMARESLDWRLMWAACPEALKDVKSGKLDSKQYAEFYDCLQSLMGFKQRYGTQECLMGGKSFISALEDPDKVEAYRKEMKLAPLKDYLAERKASGQALEVQKE